MRFGPTSLRVAGVLAKGLRRPKVRSDLVVSKQTVSGETSYVVKIPETGELSRLSAVSYELLQLCDGTRTVAEVTATWNELYPDIPFSEEEVDAFLEGLDPNTWERSPVAKNLMVLEKIRDERKGRADQHSSLLYIYFPAFDPDRWLARIHPYFRWIFTPQFVYVSLALFALSVLIVVTDYARIRQDTIEFYNFANKTAYDLWIFWVLTLAITFVHETGHGLTCKHFGGEVHQMGFMLMYFMPSFYTDCTDMALFDRSSKRVWTIMGGIWIELVIGALSTIVWFLSPPGSFVGDLGYKTLLLTVVSGVLINMNPLMKLDGYYVFSEMLQIEGLRDKSFKYLKTWVRRNLYTTIAMILIGALFYLVWARKLGFVGFLLTGVLVLLLEQSGWLDWIPVRKNVDLPAVGLRKHRIFLGYGLAAFAYGLIFLIVVALWFRNIFTTKFGDWGNLITLVIVYFILRRRIGNFVPKLWAGLKAAKEKALTMSWKFGRMQQAGGALLLAVLIIPTYVTVPAEFVLEPGARAHVRPATDGWIKEVRVREGDAVEAGAVLALLTHPGLEAEVIMLSTRRALEERLLLAARARNDLAEVQKRQKEMERVGAALREAQRRQEALTLRAPLSGRVTTPRIEQRIGEYVPAGGLFAEVVDDRTMRARVLVRDWELEDVAEGASVKLKVDSDPLRTLSGQVKQIMPAAAADRPVSDPTVVERKGQALTNFFAVTLEVPNPDGSLRAGMTGTAKILGRRYPTGWRLARSGWRWLRSLVW
ncbi:MAG TPA: PqqD family peptide modification chaperone [Candidatus Xenobia bacterium]|nr:PqqD family peptide modification chaperone [Candidatus Xenobia bacterium]